MLESFFEKLLQISNPNWKTAFYVKQPAYPLIDAGPRIYARVDDVDKEQGLSR
jgi:hypothetical protein